MTQSDSDQQQIAEGKISLGIERLAETHPFHARILERFVVRACPEIETMAVTIEGDVIPLLYNAEFVAKLTFDELQSVLLHEVHHIVFRHVLADPADYPDTWARTVAEETTVNEFITGPLPAGVITLASFTRLPPMESTDKRYARLKKVKRRPPITSPEAGAGGQDNSKTQQQSADSKTRGGTFATVDDHDAWASARKDPQRSEETIRGVVQDVAIEAGIGQIPAWLRETVLNSCHGETPGNNEEALSGDQAGKLNWIQLLRRYTGQLLRVRPDFRRPPRRFPELVGIVPGSRRQTMKPRILAVIDTSGSITTDLLELINAELSRLARNFGVTVAECDTEIHSIYRYKPIKSVQGRGGTDLRPPFEKALLRKYRPDLIIYFTDGFGPAPDRAPSIPTIWVLCPGGERPAPWGRTLRMGSVDGK